MYEDSHTRMPNDLAKLKRIMRQANYMTYEDCSRSSAMKIAWEINNFRDELRRGLVRFTYRKADGTDRVALGTLNNMLIPTAALPKSTDVNIPRERLAIITYYDLEKDGWRSFYFYSLINIDHVWPFNSPSLKS